MATVLTINGSAVSRAGNRLILNQLTLSLEDSERFTWTEIGIAAGNGSWSAGDMVSAAIDGTTRFIGQTVAAHPSGIGRGCINVTYTALGLRFLLNQIFYTAADLTGFQAWNLPAYDPEFILSRIGKTVGDIVEEALDLHQTALTAIGLATPAYDPAETAAMDVVPREPVVFTGRLLDNIQDLISQWCPKYTCYADASDGLIHFRNSLTLTGVTLTLDTDPVTLDSISKTHGECYTKAVVRGHANVQPAYLSLAEGTLERMWTSPQEAAWTIGDFWQPKGAASQGAITAQTSTTVTVTADDATEAWGTTTYWSDKGAVLWAYDPAATGITFSEDRYITANTVKAAGASGTITVDRPFNNTGYTRYQVRGTLADAAKVWRAYKIVPVDGSGHNWVADHLVATFPHSVPWGVVAGVAITVNAPTAVVCWSANGSPPYMKFPWPFQVVLPDGGNPGYIVFYEPVVKVYESQAHLIAGGANVTAPPDIEVVVPYSLGALTATKPDTGFEGTAFTADGIERTLYREYPDWLDPRDTANMLKLVQEDLDSVKDTVYEGSITYEGKLSLLLTMGKALSIGRAGGTTGWETLAALVRSVSLEYQDRASIYLTRAEFSTRRKPFTGDRLYAPVGWGQAPQLGGGGDVFGPSFDEMRAMAGAVSVAGMVNAGSYLVDPTSGLADPTAAGVDPLAGEGIRTPAADRIATGEDFGMQGAGVNAYRSPEFRRGQGAKSFAQFARETSTAPQGFAEFAKATQDPAAFGGPVESFEQFAGATRDPHAFDAPLPVEKPLRPFSTAPAQSVEPPSVGGGRVNLGESDPFLGTD